MKSDLPYLRSYPESLQDQARELLARGGLGAVLQRKYPQAHAVRSDKALYDYAQTLKSRYLRNAGTVNKVLFDNKIHVVRHALGLHTSVSRVQGSRLAAKHEIRIAAMFKQAPDEFLRMIVVHELAHLREKEHDKAFYQLCTHMEPQYHQYEFDLRLYLTHIEHAGERLWGTETAENSQPDLR
ncbi:MAG: M48 family metallopeptidase [Gammaproteobacteria bacterium]|jgi:UTP pyrophosphatase|nr:M48 family metallopeptidase [Gammaproteobacteria bacterium]